MLPQSHELSTTLGEAQKIAAELNQVLTSAHVLLCLFTTDNCARRFLNEQNITIDVLLKEIDSQPEEKSTAWERVMRRAEDVASVHKSAQLDTLHLLVAMCSFTDSAAYQLMVRLNVRIADIRTAVMGFLQEKNHAPPASATAQDPGTPPLQSALRRDSAAPHIPAPTQGIASPASPWDSTPQRRDAEPATPPPPKAEPVRGRGRSLARRLSSREPVREDEESDNRVSLARRKQLTMNLPSAPPPSAMRLKEQRAKTESADKRPAVAFNPKRYSLPKAEFPLLSRIGRNLSELAVEGQLERAIGRDEIIERMIDVLNARRANNPLLIGDPGVGKTAVVEGLARHVIDQAREGLPTGLENRIIVSVEASSLIAGTSLRGAFAERISQLKQEVARAAGRVIVFLDELHHWIGAGSSSDSGSDAAGELKTALARGEFPCVGATTWEEFTRYIEPDQAFSRRFQTIRVGEPTIDDTIAIVRGLKEQYELHHDLSIPDSCIEEAARLTQRFLPQHRNPDKTIRVIDLACSLERRTDRKELSLDVIAQVIGDNAGIDPARLTMADRERFARLPDLLQERIVGHDDAVTRVANVLQRNYAGFIADRPIGSFLFLGPTGVGKTEFARAVADVLFDDRQAVVRLDMSEYMEAHAVARLIGSPPGYVGFEAGGQLTEPVRRSPYQLVLLDEIEKAHPDVLNVLIQLLDEGRLTDSRGRTVDFTHTIVVMTSNLGAEAMTPGSRPRSVGFASPTREDNYEEALKDARKHFRPELWNRIDEAIVFPALDEEQVKSIARRMLAQSNARFARRNGISFSCDEAALDALVALGGYKPDLGARPMRRTIERLIETEIARAFLLGDIERGDSVLISARDETLTFTTHSPADESSVDADDVATGSDAACEDAAVGTADTPTEAPEGQVEDSAQSEATGTDRS